MTVKEIDKICFIGAGTMGCWNSLVAAISGYEVSVYDVAKESLQHVVANQKDIGAYLTATGFCTPDELAASAARITCVEGIVDAVADADLVSESVVEDLSVKRDLHAELDKLCPPKTILTTNTSGFLVSDIENVVTRGDRFAALHSHYGSHLIDIVGGPRTSAATIDILNRYVLSTNNVPLILKKENRGYVLNALIGPVVSNAMLLLCEGLASKQDIDRAWMKHRNAPMGPFGMMDLFGLNVVYDGWQHRPADPAIDDLKQKVLSLLGSLIEKGELGLKTGKGFYNYPNPEFENSDFLDDVADASYPHNVLTSALVSNAILLAANGVSDRTEIDRAWMVGMILDTGPFTILDEIGTDAYLQLLHSQATFLSPQDTALIEQYLTAIAASVDG